MCHYFVYFIVNIFEIICIFCAILHLFYDISVLLDRFIGLVNDQYQMTLAYQKICLPVCNKIIMVKNPKKKSVNDKR